MEIKEVVECMAAALELLRTGIFIIRVISVFIGKVKNYLQEGMITYIPKKSYLI